MKMVDAVYVIGVALMLFFLVSLGDWVTSTSDDDRPCPTPAKVTVFVPAGPQVCPEEDSCRLDYDGTRWVIIPEVTP